MLAVVLVNLPLSSATATEQSLGELMQLSPRDQATLQQGIKSWRTHKVLFGIAKKCKNNEFTPLAPITDLNKAVEKVLNISPDKFELVLKQQTQEYAKVKQQIEAFDCKQTDLSEQIEEVYDRYDIAIFSFSGSMPVTQRLLTSEEMDKYNQQFAEQFDLDTPQRINKHYQNSASVFIGMLVHFDDLTPRLRNKYYNLRRQTADNEYLYLVDEGWKGRQTKYLRSGLTTQVKSTGGIYPFAKSRTAPITDKVQIDAMLGVKYVFFVGQDNLISTSAPLDEIKENLKVLGKVHWRWRNGELVKTKKTGK